MAVVDEYYRSARNPGKNALVAWLGSFLDEREAMNQQLLAARLKAATGDDDAKLLTLEVQLRRQASELAAAKQKAMSGEKQGQMNLLGDIIGADAKMNAAYTNAQATTSAATSNNRTAIRTEQMKIDEAERAASVYDPKAMAEAKSLVDQFGSKRVMDRDETTPDFDGLVNGLNGVALRNKLGGPGDPKYDAFVRDAANYAASHNGADPQVAAGLGLSLIGHPDPAAYFTQAHGGMSEEQIRTAQRTVGAGVSRPAMLGQIDDYLSGKIAAGEVGGEETERETRSEGAATPAGAGGEGGGPYVSGVRIRGATPLAMAFGAALGNEHPDTSDYDRSLAAINRQIAAIEAKRRAGSPALFTGANYLLDNPNRVVDTRVYDALDKVAKRDPATEAELRTYEAQHRTGRGAAKAMVRDEFNPDTTNTVPDVAGMSQGGEAQVYRYVADVLRSGVPGDADRAMLLKQVPPAYRDTVESYLQVAKTHPAEAIKGLEASADQDDTTFRSAWADELEHASKDGSRIPAVVDSLQNLAGDEVGGAWANHALHAFDQAAKTGDVHGYQSALGRLAGTMREGDKLNERMRREGAEQPVYDLGTAEIDVDGAPRTFSDDENHGRKLAETTYAAWRRGGMSTPAIQAKVDEINETSPLMRSFKARVQELVGPKDLPPPESPWTSGDEEDEDITGPGPNPAVVNEYRRKLGAAQ